MKVAGHTETGLSWLIYKIYRYNDTPTNSLFPGLLTYVRYHRKREKA